MLRTEERKVRDIIIHAGDVRFGFSSSAPEARFWAGWAKVRAYRTGDVDASFWRRYWKYY
jgi:hypothetical protein